MALEHMRKCSSSLITRKTQNNTEISLIYQTGTNFKVLAQILKYDNTFCQGGCEETATLTHCWGNANRCNPSAGELEFGNT